ncbi:DUF443 family protein [Lactococcus ileimucosae]|uniref:DUF443 family protein n=1 Tax=Lactococcus ileimucosae TaxID=2941329 RepID=UPI0020437C85|nr:DUF443 family protein [Lactococcus ileimucosae]
MMKLKKTESLRYRICDIEEKHYLIDLDTERYSWLLPFHIWNRTYRAAEITDEQIKSLSKNWSKKSNDRSLKFGFPFVSVTGAVVGGSFYRLIGGAEVFDSIFWLGKGHTELLLTILLLIMISMFLIRYILSMKSKKSLDGKYFFTKKVIFKVNESSKQVLFSRFSLMLIAIFIGIIIMYLNAVVIVITLPILTYIIYFYLFATTIVDTTPIGQHVEVFVEEIIN